MRGLALALLGMAAACTPAPYTMPPKPVSSGVPRDARGEPVLPAKAEPGAKPVSCQHLRRCP